MVFDKDTHEFKSQITGGTLPEDIASKLLYGLVAGLLYLHSKLICHRDIKVRWYW